MRAKQLCSITVVSLGLTAVVTGCDLPIQWAIAPSREPVAAKTPVPMTVKQVKPKTQPDPTRTVTLDTSRTAEVLGLRKFPYPYQAMLAISSDADGETLRKFNLIHEFVNTTAMTPLSHGLGLDFSNSFFMYNGNNLPAYTDVNHEPMSMELTYFKGVSHEYYGANVINHYIHSGWIDTMHSYGDFSQVDQTKTLFRRQLAKQAISDMMANHDEIIVWTDHGNKSNVDNFGAYGENPFYSYQQGANPWSSYYHTNWTIPYGIKFVWSDFSSDKFGMSSMIYPIRLPDGRWVWGFWRYTNLSYNSKGSPVWNWSPNALDEQLTGPHFLAIETKHQYSIVATHLSGNNTEEVLPPSSVHALQLLAEQYHHGKILVARTSRLLNYNVAEEYVKYDTTYADGKVYVHILSIADPVFGTHVPSLDEVRGLTFYTTNPSRTVIEIGNTPISVNDLQDNPSDGIAPSVSIRWFSADTTNYAETVAGVS